MKYRQTIHTSTKLAAWYDAKYVEMGGTWVTPQEECNKHLDDLGVPFDPSKTLLDVGCGGGHFLAEASKRVECWGFEISLVAIRHAWQRAPQAIVIATNIEYKPLEHHIGFFDYVVSLGSLEHVIDIGRALDNIRELLKHDGRFYFYCPNENWVHEDQPNERTMTDGEWMDLFRQHGLHTLKAHRWNDSTAFTGCKTESTPVTATPDFTGHTGLMLNLGSGQRPFTKPWINVDCQAKWNPDVLADAAKMTMFPDGSARIVVLHHVLEHLGCGDGGGMLREGWRVLEHGGSLLVFLPDIEALARRWLSKGIDDYTYIVNLMGAYMGEDADRHKWHYTFASLAKAFNDCGTWRQVKLFDWRGIEGADIARAWWILGVEAIK